MRTGKDIEQLVENTMNSLDGMTAAETSPWFYARLQARMMKKLQPMIPLWLKPQLVLPVLTILVGLNIWSLTGTVSTRNSADTVCDFASYYNMSRCDNSAY
jgi:hypothetical protein